MEVQGEMNIAGTRFPVEIRRLTDGYLATNTSLLLTAKSHTQNKALENLKQITYDYIKNHEVS